MEADEKICRDVYGTGPCVTALLIPHGFVINFAIFWYHVVPLHIKMHS